MRPLPGVRLCGLHHRGRGRRCQASAQRQGGRWLERGRRDRDTGAAARAVWCRPAAGDHDRSQRRQGHSQWPSRRGCHRCCRLYASWLRRRAAAAWSARAAQCWRMGRPTRCAHGHDGRKAHGHASRHDGPWGADAAWGHGGGVGRPHGCAHGPAGCDPDPAGCTGCGATASAARTARR